MAEIKKEDLINELIHLQTISEELFNYHPDNPNKTDVVTAYNTIQDKIKSIEDSLANL